MDTTATKTALSVSVSSGKVSELHTRRVYCPYSADPALTGRNVHVIDPCWDDYEDGEGPRISYEDQINYWYEESILEYNSRQKRKDRQKDPEQYYAELTREGSQIKPVYSYVIQLGNRETCGTCDAAFDTDHYKALAATERSEYAAEHANDSELHGRVVQALTQICEEFGDRYPNFEVLAAVIHDDEPCGGPHATIDFCPRATGYKRGMKERVGMSKALEEMGFKSFDKHADHAYSIVNWQNDLKQWISDEIMPEYGLTRRVMENHEPHRDVPEFKAWKRKQEREAAKKQTEAETNVADIEPEFTRKNGVEELETEVQTVTENEALSIDLSAQIQTQQAQLAALVAEREREEDEREQRKQKHAQLVEEQQDEIDRLRAEAAKLREELADGHAILERLTRPLMAFVDWFCNRCRPAVRDTWRDRFGKWINAYETDLAHEFHVEDPDKPAPVWTNKGTTFGGQFQAGQYLR